ncbi:threonine transporter [Streptomyces sp. ISL-44]|uniref:ABC-three component system middle component 2 n=1 Tax=Streptomyces sp. ISL-44 TaxID=2819184 RepID=UPI001BEA80BA|nr:ABC-three component system middle component 2 [Streptomyces sp. ISL-44]MBT2539668.1 threonine transporter [Streptomyces sp. ISL-44]
MNPLNSPLEVGIRALALLSETFPRRLDVAQLVYLDHAMLHSGDLDQGPASLHPDLPVGPGELGMRRNLIEQGLVVLMRAGLADMTATEEGFLYGATEEAASFLDILEAPYIGQLRSRAAWLTTTYVHEETDVRDGMKQITQRWTDRFHVADRAEGDDQ